LCGDSHQVEMASRQPRKIALLPKENGIEVQLSHQIFYSCLFLIYILAVYHGILPHSLR
jgi:hypothetical protein